MTLLAAFAIVALIVALVVIRWLVRQLREAQTMVQKLQQANGAFTTREFKRIQHDRFLAAQLGQQQRVHETH